MTLYQETDAEYNARRDAQVARESMQSCLMALGAIVLCLVMLVLLVVLMMMDIRFVVPDWMGRMVM